MGVNFPKVDNYTVFFLENILMFVEYTWIYLQRKRNQMENVSG